MNQGSPIQLDDYLATRLAAAALARGTTEAGLITIVLERFLDADDRCAHLAPIEGRLACMSRQLTQLEQEIRYVRETAALHARYHLAVTPAFDDDERRTACAIGSARFDEFAVQVERRVRAGQPLIRETLSRARSDKAQQMSANDAAGREDGSTQTFRCQRGKPPPS